MTLTFASFVTQLEDTSAGDVNAHRKNLQDARKLLAAAKQTAPPEVTRLLAAGVFLLEIAAGPEGLLVERSEAQASAKGMVDLVNLALERARDKTPLEPEPSAKDSAKDSAEKAPAEGADSELPEDPEEAARTPRPIHEEMVLGRVLVELGHTTHAQIAQALEFQQGKGLPIGECLLLLGLTSPDRILDALRLQERMRAMDEPSSIQEVWSLMQQEAPEAPLQKEAQDASAPETPFPVGEEMFLGEVLLGAGMITNTDLEKAMHEHHFTGKSVGQALLEMGALDQEELKRGLDLQATLRGVAGLKSA